MSNCANGSQKKSGAPDSFTIDTGAVCFLLGIESPICSILDSIPDLIGQPWRKILSNVASQALGVAIEQITDRINTDAFCSIAPPEVPDEISYADIFSFVASYVPPFSFVASADGLLGKITKYYLNQKWYEYCECKKREQPEPPDGSIEPIPPFVPSCAASAIYQSTVQGAIDFANSRNQSQGGVLANFTQFSDGGSVNSITQEQYDEFLSSYLSPEPPLFLNGETSSETGFQNSYNTNSIGCIEFQTRGGNFYNTLRTFSIGNTDLGTVDLKYLGVDKFQPLQIKYDDSDCCDVPPPPPPKVPKEPDHDNEDCECIPVPPPEFCVAFPNSPLCANVPPNNNQNGECEVTTIVVSDYDCETGFTTKNVQWKL